MDEVTAPQNSLVNIFTLFFFFHLELRNPMILTGLVPAKLLMNYGFSLSIILELEVNLIKKGCMEILNVSQAWLFPHLSACLYIHGSPPHLSRSVTSSATHFCRLWVHLCTQTE